MKEENPQKISDEERLKNSLRYRELLENVNPHGIISFDANGEIQTINERAAKFLKVDQEKAMDMNLSVLFQSKVVAELVLNAKDDLTEEMVTILGKRYIMNLKTFEYEYCENTKLGKVLLLTPLVEVEKLAQRITGSDARFTYNDMIGESEVIKQVLILAKKAADSKLPLLIEGETGTGKELIAQAVHNGSKRVNNPFVVLNCSALSRELFESELFGYEDGAFTGAKKGGHIGKFELANSGTLFLDEIGELPPDVQAKLLRAIELGEFWKIGGKKVIKVNLRIITATNRDLKKEVEKGRFRKDLYFRLNGLRIKIPPLRERKKDIPLLANYFLKREALSQVKSVETIDEKALAKLVNYDWPGNVRELENVIAQAVSISNKSAKVISENEIDIKGEKDEKIISIVFQEGKTFDEMIDEYGRKLLTTLLSENQWHQTNTAKMLGISEQALRYKMRKYNITKPEI